MTVPACSLPLPSRCKPSEKIQHNLFFKPPPPLDKVEFDRATWRSSKRATVFKSHPYYFDSVCCFRLDDGEERGGGEIRGAPRVLHL